MTRILVPRGSITPLPRGCSRAITQMTVRCRLCSDTQTSTPMTPEDRSQMVELVKRIARETDPKRLAVWINDLNELIQSKIRELRETRKTE